MNLPDKVEIQDDTVISYDNEGVAFQAWSAVDTIQADMQPLGGELAYKQYGITEAGITKRMFCEVNAEVQMGRRVVVNETETYEIRYVAAFRDHYEVLLKPV